MWHSQFFPRALWPAVEFYSRIPFHFTAVEDSISFLSSRVIHMRDYTSRAEVLGLGSDPPLALSPALSQSPDFWTRPLLSAGNSSFFCIDLRNSVASSLSHAAACFPPPCHRQECCPEGLLYSSDHGALQGYHLWSLLRLEGTQVSTGMGSHIASVQAQLAVSLLLCVCWGVISFQTIAFLFFPFFFLSFLSFFFSSLPSFVEKVFLVVLLFYI